MHTLEPELRSLQQAGRIDDATAARTIALERGDVLSVHSELRVATYVGVLMITGGVGLLLARNLDRLGPLTIALAIAAAAALCYATAIRGRLAGRTPTAVGEYVLLLGALLASADLAYAERQFALLGPLWSWHLLILAVAHAATAYAFRSPLVLAAALTALVGWFGIGGTFTDPLRATYTAPELGLRALACAALVFAWRHADRRQRPATTFTETFDQFAANLAFWAALAWCLNVPWLFAGAPLLAGLAAAAVRRSFATGRESYLVYGVGYAALGVCFLVVPRIVGGGTVAMSFVLLVVCVASIALWQLRRRLREPAP